MWWRSLSGSTTVSVRFPHAKHGNAGKASNSAKETVMDDFLTFVDINSQPNGRSDDSSGPTRYFLPKFTTVQAPKPGTSYYQERLRRSVVGEFIRSQTESRRGTCSNWLKKHRPKLSICPHQEDYCDTCSKRKEGSRAKRTTINRLLASASADASLISRLEDEKRAINQAFERHRHEAEQAHKYYVGTTKKCGDEWAEITELEGRLSLKDEEEERLTVMNVVISADYQMSKLVPYWGLSPQPGSTYYLQKLSHDIYGVVNHATNSSAVYLLDERVGPKNIDHTIPYTTHYNFKPT